MNQDDLNRAVAKATMESIDIIDSLGFSLLSPSAAYSPAIPAERRKYPLRIAREARKRKPRRKRVKSFAKPISVVRAVAG